MLKDNTIQRRRLLQLVGATSAAGLAGCLGGGDDSEPDNGEYPTQPVRMIVPAGEGGGTDTYVRQIMTEAEQVLDQNIQIDNIPGAASIRGVGEMMLSEPNGYTTVSFNPPSTPLAWLLDPQDWDVQEAQGVCRYAVSPLVVIANSDYGITDLNDLTGRYEEGDLTHLAGMSRGHMFHVLAMILRDWWGVEWEQYVPYDGSGPIAQAVAADEVPVGITSEGGAEGVVEAGEADVVVTTASGGSNVFPDVDSGTDLGYENIDFIGQMNRGIYMPPETPREAISVFADAIDEAIQTDALQSWSEESGNPLTFDGPEVANAVLEDAVDEIVEVVDIEELRDEV